MPAFSQIARSRWTYIGIMVGFMLWLALAGGGRTQSMWAFQRRVNVRLQQLVRGVVFNNINEGVIKAEGEGVFRLMLLDPIFERYQKELLDLDQVAELLAAKLTADLDFYDGLTTWEEERDRMLLLPLPRIAISPLLTPEDRAVQYVVAQSELGWPVTLCLLDTENEVVRPMLKEYLKKLDPDLTPRAAVRQVQRDVKEKLLEREIQVWEKIRIPGKLPLTNQPEESYLQWFALDDGHNMLREKMDEWFVGEDESLPPAIRSVEVWVNSLRKSVLFVNQEGEPAAGAVSAERWFIRILYKEDGSLERLEFQPDGLPADSLSLK
jgi:hypothetical protein